MNELLWKVYYGDGTAFSNLDGDPDLAPALGVQAITQRDEVVGRYILSRFDFYWFDQEQWYGSDQFGLWDYLQRTGWKRVLFGRSLPNLEFREVWQEVLADDSFPKKSGWLNHEQR